MALAAALLAAAAIAAPTPAQLLARHVPVLELAPAEPYLPSTVEPFLALTQDRGAYLDVTDCDPAAGPEATDCYRPLSDGPVTYGRALTTPTRIVLSYWLFYPYNPWSVRTPAGDVVWRSHEGDWEVVLVVLDRRGSPLQVGYSQHCRGERRAWRSAPRRGSRPLVRVALGSHANYPGRGRHVHDPRCWPDAANVVFRAVRTEPVDVAGGGAVVRPRLVRLAPAPPWLSYGGAWGETGWFHAGEADIAYGLGPKGPAFQAEWRTPLRELARWPLRR